MYLPKLKKYDKKFDFSYAFGAFPTIDLLKNKKELVMEVIIHPDGSSSEGVEEIVSICNQNRIPVNYSKPAIEKIAFKENTYVIGVFKKFASKLEIGSNHVVLANPSNTGNLGTIIRTMVGFGIKNLAIISPAVDVFDPKVLRSSMGAFFAINFEYFNSIEEYQKMHKNNLYSFMLNADYEIANVKYDAPFSLVFGNEGAGLPENYRNFSKTVYIKHSKEIDSLNLSVCVGIALFGMRA